MTTRKQASRVRGRFWVAAVGLALVLIMLALPAGATGTAVPSAQDDSPTAVTATELPIVKGDSWRYFKGISSAPPTGWKAASFDDSSWYQGTTPFGYGGSPAYDLSGGTTLSDMQNSYLSVFFRRKFNVASLADVPQLSLFVDYDDGFIAYLNGKEIGRRNLGGTGYLKTASSDHAAGTPEELVINLALTPVKVGNNVLAIQVHNLSKSSSDYYASMELTTGSAPPPAELVKGPYLQNVTKTSIVVMWQTDSAAPSKLHYRLPGAATWIEVANSTPKEVHELTISGLVSNKTYEYQVSTDGAGDWTPTTAATFKTAPGGQVAFRAVVYGDTRTSNSTDKHQKVIDRILATPPKPAIFFNTGDLVNLGKEESSWDYFFSPAEALMINTPLYPVLGNHEYRPLESTDPLLYYKYFSLPGNEQYYAFSYGCARFVVLDAWRGDDGMESDADPNPTYGTGTAQYNWLVNELNSQAFKRANWQFVLLHNPPFTTTDVTIDDDSPLVVDAGHPANKSVQKYLVPLFEQKGVDMVFSAHNHRFEHTKVNNVHYFVTAGGGAPFYPCGPTPWPYGIDTCKPNKLHFMTLDITCGATKSLNVQAITNTGASLYTLSLP